MTTTNQTIDRRSFLKISTAAGGGLLIGMNWLAACRPESAVEGLTAVGDFVEMNAYLKIAENGVTTIWATNPEVGQGVKTALPMIVAEELDIPWKMVVVEQAPLNTEAYPRQVAGGSYSVRSLWDVLRQAGATARHLLVATAAQRWDVDAGECTTADGFVIHPDGKQKFNYGELVNDAAKMEAPEEVTLKDPDDYKVIGTNVPNVDNDEIVTGKPLFGPDFRREGMLFAMVVRPPAFGQTLQSVDDTAAKSMPGIKHVVTFDNKVAVTGESTWQVKKGRDALRITWQDPAKLDNTADHDAALLELLKKKPADPVRKDGDAEGVFKSATKIVEGIYEAPFLPHNPMSPMNYFAHVREDGIELYGPSQTPKAARDAVARMLNVPEDKITVGMSRMGGGFGRRLRTDFAEDAAMVSSLVKAPVLVVWTREDDMTAGIYRPAAKYHYRAAINDKNELVGWHMRAAGINSNNATLPDDFPAGALDNFLVEYHNMESHVTTGAWRAPTHNYVAFSQESFTDEIAHALGKDPVQFRLELLQKAKDNGIGKVEYNVERYRKVIEMVAEMAGWGKTKPEGIFQGIGAHFSYGAYMAQVADVSVDNGNIKIHKVYCAVDCGIVINPDGAANQIEGGIIDGIGHAMYGDQPIHNGVPAYSNFHNYRLIKMNEAPDIEVQFVKNKERPEGIGEPGLPPAGAAVANAVFAATGVRMRKQPFVQNKLVLG
jgi:isoquinoline 1-oxidoreductase subunit beta